MKHIAFLAGVLLANSAQGSVFTFNTEDHAINARACLEQSKPHGAMSQWACVDGILQALTPNSGLRFLQQAQDAIVRVEISQMIPIASEKGKGETVIWLRNGAEGGVTKRLRVVIEQVLRTSTSIRLEEFDGARYNVLAKGKTRLYQGSYDVQLIGKELVVSKGTDIVRANVNIDYVGSIYLFSSGGEGGVSGYDEVELEVWNR